MDEIGETDDEWDLDLQQREFLIGIGIKLVNGKYIWRADEKGNLYQELVVNDINSYEERLKLNANGEPYYEPQKGLNLMDDWGYSISNDDESRLGETDELDDNKEGEVDR